MSKVIEIGLLEDLVSYFREYVRVGEDEYVVLSPWVLHSDCGKTLLLEVAELVVPRPMLVSDCTEASFARAIEKWRPTLLVDEFDQTLEGDTKLLSAVLKTINSGTRRVASV
jgi:hypothetical protein